MASFPRSPHLYQLMAAGTIQRYKKNAAVYATDEDHHLMLVKSGYVKRYMIKNDGSLGVQIIYGPQDVFSLTTMFRHLFDQSIYEGPETYYYQTIGEAELYIMNLDDFRAAAAAEPLLYRELLSEAGCHLKYCVHDIENIALDTAYARVAHQLLFFAREFGQPVAAGVRIDVPLTHQDLADILGTTRATVTVAVNKLRSAGVLTASRQLVVSELTALSREAYA